MKIKYLIGVFLSIFAATVTSVQGQNNTNCESPITLTNNVAYSESTLNAGSSGNPSTDPNGTPIGNGVWFAITTPPYNVRLNVSTCGSSYNGNTDLIIYTNACGGNPVTWANGSNPFGCNSDAGISVSASANTTYYILASGTYSASGTLDITATLSTPPTNDTCASPITLTNGVTYSETNFNATEFGDPIYDPNGNPIGRGVWFAITTPPYNVRLNVSTCGSSYNGNTDLILYTNACGGNPVTWANGSNPFGCNSDAGISVSASANTTYYILASGTYSVSGTLDITATLSTPPTNDTCASPITLTNGVTYSETNFNATEFGDPVYDPNGTPIGRGVWFAITTPPYNVRLNVSTCGSSYNGNTDLILYTNACGGNPVTWANGSNPFGCNSDAGISVSASANTTYYILASGTYSASGTLDITATLSTPPTNDTCASPITLTNGVTYSETNFNATEFGDPVYDPNGTPIGRGVWFAITTPPYNVRLNVSTCGSSYNGNTDLIIYTNACGGNPVTWANGSNPFGCNSDAGISVSASANTTYYILASGTYSASGTLDITATLSTPPTNDTCASPITLTNGVTYSETNFNATEFGDPVYDPNGTPIGRGVWFAITTPPYNVRLNVSTCGSSYNGNTDLILYTNACGGNPVTWANGSNPFGCNSDAGISVSASANTTYYILASGTYSASGTLDITATLSTPPTNDTCASPITLTNGVTYSETNFNATEFGDPVDDPNGNPIGRGVWFTLNAYSNQPVTISTCNSSYNGNIDLIIYTNACGGNPVTWANGSNPFGCSGDAGVSFIAPANETYYILASGTYSAWGTLNITANTPPPTNDVCSGAMPMTAGVTYTTNTVYATSIGDPVPSCVPSFGRGVWYEYTPAVSGLVGVTTAGSSFQTGLAVYKGSCGSLSEVACSESSGAYNSSGLADVNFSGEAGTPYYILAGGVNGQAGTLQILIPIVDLVSSAFTATNPAGGLITAGRTFSAGWTVQNQGSNSINGTWTDSLSLTNASTNVVIASFNSRHNAPAGGSYTETYDNLMPPVAAGNYTLVATADAGDDVAEVTKTNNVQLLSITITNIPPSVTLLEPTNQLVLVSCVQVPVRLAAQVQFGSYAITNVLFYDSNSTNMIGSLTNSPYRTTSLALGFGTNIIGVMALDSFGLVGFSTNLATVTLRYPTNLNVLSADFATNGDYVGCMCAYAGSNYLVLTTTNLAIPGPLWQAYITNLTTTNVLSFTNHPTAPRRFFRAKLLP